MTDRSSFDAFEQRIAAGLERYVEPAVDPKPASEIAEVAMQPRGLTGRVRGASQRRLLLLGLAAALLVPAAYIGAMATRPPTPNPVVQVQPTRTDDPRPTNATNSPDDLTPRTILHAVSIFVRRDDGPEPGLSIVAVQPDGTETLVRRVPDSITSGPGTLSVWGAVSESGWLALSKDVYGGPCPVILIDLTDASADPWVLDEANIGAIGPRWGPTGLLAAPITMSNILIADPATRTTRKVTVGSLLGGGPTIVWSADGGGIVDSRGQVHPIDGSPAGARVAQVFDPGGIYGPGLAELRICPDMDCGGDRDGRVERVEVGGSTRTIWTQAGADRALGAGFGQGDEEYWLSADHASGRQVELRHLHDGSDDTITTISRNADWSDVAAPAEAPDHASLLVGIYRGDDQGAVVVPLTGGGPTFHTGHFAGFVDSAASAAFAAPTGGTPGATLAPKGEVYRLPSLDALIAAELKVNPGRTVLGKASREAVVGKTDVRTFEVKRDKPGQGDVYLDCYGPSSVTVTSGSQSITSPCLRAGSYA